MQTIRNRAKEHLPTVLLTLTSIVQALALELLWSHVQERPFFMAWSFESVAHWLQVIGTLLGIMLIWVIYANNVMRLRWVPSMGDSLAPFVIGISEFLMVEFLTPTTRGWWLISMAFIFGFITWTMHASMRRARQDPDNEAFFRGRASATLRDFLPTIVIVGILLTMGVYAQFGETAGVVDAAFVAFTVLLICWQFVDAGKFWRDSLNQED